MRARAVRVRGGGVAALILSRTIAQLPRLAAVRRCRYRCRFRIAYETYCAELEHNDRAILDGETEGFVKLTCAKGSAVVLGGTIVAAHAGDLISEVTLAVKEGLTIESLARTIHSYPTVGESVMGAALGWVRAHWKKLE